MKLHALTLGNQNLFSGYGEGYVEVNKTRYEGSLIVMSDRIAPWSVKQFSVLEKTDFTALLDWQPELVLLATGKHIQFPHPALTAALFERNIGVEALDVGATCRTFNILLAEGRNVMALILHA